MSGSEGVEEKFVSGLVMNGGLAVTRFVRKSPSNEQEGESEVHCRFILSHVCPFHTETPSVGRAETEGA
jgi:hypothetical protein